jgi:hypothetical protein
MSGPTARRGAGVCVMRERLLIAGVILALGPSRKQQAATTPQVLHKPKEERAVSILHTSMRATLNTNR